MCRFFSSTALCLLLVCPAADRMARGEVVRMEIQDRLPFAEGHSFGRTGPYEIVRGRMQIQVDPDSKAQAMIRDLELAPRNEQGKVEAWTDFFLLKPVDASRGNRRLLFDVANRGNKLALWTFNGARSNHPTTLADAGDGFLMHHGYSILWCGWDGDVVEDGNQRVVIDVPVAQRNGQTITGPAHVEISVDEPVRSRAFFYSPWGTSRAYPAVDLDHQHATLTKRPRRSADAIEVCRSRWSFARWEDGQAVPDPTHLYVEDGFRPGWLYDLVYIARDPRVSGLGLAAVRDTVSFFRYAEHDEPGTPNPLAGQLEKAYGFGISQSGRMLHHFVYEGFNADASGRIVFDALLAHVAGAGKGMFNHRFRMATVFGTHHTGNLAASEFFPFSPATQTDPVTGEQGNTLARARRQECVPKMIFTQTSTEYWNRAASLMTTDVAGQQDLTLPDTVRVYLVAGAQHLGAGPTTPGICQQPRSPLDDRGPILRAMLIALDRWASGLGEPPPNRYPRIDDGTLVDLETFHDLFPEIPGVNRPTGYFEPPRLDFGPRFFTQGIAEILPPHTGKPYRTLVPAVDEDGNEIAGIRLPDIEAPLGTYTGWNLRAPEFGAPEMLSPLDGMYLPFPATAAERAERGDPRAAVAERYPERERYLARFLQATLTLQEQGFLLPRDALTLLQTAASREHWD